MKRLELYIIKQIRKGEGYDNVKIHIIRDNFLELNIYYFEGLNKIGIETQDKALKKIYE